MKLPLAIYTADHGLKWTFDESKISYGDLDLCRTMFGRLPDFDLGEAGFEGVAVVGDRVFVVRCFSASKWDFLGRDATYLVATWFDRRLVCSMDLEALLKSQELNVPMKEPPLSFSFCVKGVRSNIGFSKLVREYSCEDKREPFRCRRSIGGASIASIGAPLCAKLVLPQPSEGDGLSRWHIASVPRLVDGGQNKLFIAKLTATFVLGVIVGIIIAGFWSKQNNGNGCQRREKNVAGRTISGRKQCQAPNHMFGVSKDIGRRLFKSSPACPGTEREDGKSGGCTGGL